MVMVVICIVGVLFRLLCLDYFVNRRLLLAVLFLRGIRSSGTRTAIEQRQFQYSTSTFLQVESTVERIFSPSGCSAPVDFPYEYQVA